jgi:putative transposase
MMKTFRKMVNHSIKIGLKNNCSTLKRLSLLAYHDLDSEGLNTSYKLNAISQACGILANHKKLIRKGKNPKTPHVVKPFLANCYGFKINGSLLSIPYKPHQPINILLNSHTTKILSDPTLKVCSFCLTAFNVSLCISKEVQDIECTKTIGIDRNLRNVTVGNSDLVTYYKTNKLLSIKENTIHARAGFKRNDQRVKQRFWQRKNQRMQNRTKQFIHKISKQIVQNAKEVKSMIVLEDLKGIRKLYKKGNGQGNNYRRKLNGWQFYELQRQVQYKASWEGIPVKFVDPKCTSKLCPVCGNRIQEDRQNSRKLWCSNCMKSMDRDVVASLNIAYKGWARFTHHKGDTVEAQSGIFEPAMTEPRLSDYDKLAIRIVDVSKSGYR